MHINKQVSGLQHPPKTALSYGKSMNNERRGVNCVHIWFLKQKEVKSQLSQWVSLSNPGKKLSSSFFFLKKKPLFFHRPWKRLLPSPFLQISEKYLFFFPKKYLFPEKQISSLEKTNIFLFFFSFLPFLCPPHDLCCSHLFFLTHSFCSPLFL